MNKKQIILEAYNTAGKALLTHQVLQYTNGVTQDEVIEYEPKLYSLGYLSYDTVFLENGGRPLGFKISNEGKEFLAKSGF